MWYLYTGNDVDKLRSESKGWQKRFIAKHNAEGLEMRKDIKDEDLEDLRHLLFATSLFSEKRLIIFDNTYEYSYSKIVEDFFIDNLQQVDDNTIIVFFISDIDKRKAFYKFMKKNATKHLDFALDNASASMNYSALMSKYSSIIDPSGLRYLSDNLSSKKEIENTIDKLSLVTDFITIELIKETVPISLESNIFKQIDFILADDITGFIRSLEHIDSNEYFPFIAGLLSNIQLQVYIKTMQEKKIPANTIIADLNLGRRSFLVTKTSRISLSKLKKLYLLFIDFDIDVKSGKTITSDPAQLSRELSTRILAAMKKNA